MVRRRRRGLDPDTMAWIALDALAANLAMDLAYGDRTRRAAAGGRGPAGRRRPGSRRRGTLTQCHLA